METNVPALLDGSVNEEELLEFLGQTKSSQNNLSRLKINRESLDDEEREIPVGTYSLYITDHGKVVYFKDMVFRPMLSGFQYRVWDVDKNTYSNKSIIFKKWNVEPLDELGGVACGKIRGALKKDMSKDEEADQKSIRCVRIIWGLVSGTAVDNEGKTVEVTLEPCVFYAQGLSYQIMDSAISSLTRRGKKIIYHQFIMTTKREKRGGNTFYIAQTELDGVEQTFTAEHMDFVRKFQATVDYENGEVVAKYNAVHTPKEKGATLKDLEFDDVLPEVMAEEA